MSVIPAAAAAVLTISFLILSMTSRAVLSQLPADFYINPSPTAELAIGGTETFGPTPVPTPIANIKDFPNSGSVTGFGFQKGSFSFADPNIPITFNIDVLRADPRSVLTEGRATLSVSTDTTLLTRALNDITAVYGPVAFTPTHVFLFTNTDIRASASTQGTTFQLVIATNGQYTFGILQFVSVEPAAATRGDRAELNYPMQMIMRILLPYSTNVTEATILSNTGTEGKYLLDLNEIPPPPLPPCNCKKRLLLIACETLKQQNSTIPRPCTE